MNNQFDWTRQSEDRLRALWADGHSTAQIGLAMGASKNAIVGKAHRLRLPSRESPIHRNGTPRPKRPKPGTRIALSFAPAAAVAAIVIPPPVAIAPLFLVSHVDEARDTSTAIPEAANARIVGGMGCQFPLWPFGQRPGLDPKFCEAPRFAIGKPYCAARHAKAYLGVPVGLFAERAA